MQLYDFLIIFFVGFISQIIKIILDIIKEKKFKINFLRRSGGFPSVHSSLTASLTTLMGLKYGIDSAYFTISIVFSFLFWYDAINIRYEAGKHARMLKNISENIKNILLIEDKIQLKERLGHTTTEVITGIIIGITLTLIFYYILNAL